MKETIYEPKRLTLRAVNNTLYAFLEVIVVFPSGKAIHRKTELHPKAVTKITFCENGEITVAPEIIGGEPSKPPIDIQVTIPRLFKAVHVKEKGINKFGRLLSILSGQHRASDDYDLGGAVIDIDLRATLVDGQVLKVSDKIHGRCGTLDTESPYTKRIVLE